MNPIVKLAASALPGEKKYILFAGAGVSKDANLPTSWDLMLHTASKLYAEEYPEVKTELNPIELENWFKDSKYGQLSFSELIDELFPHYPDQQSFFQNFLADKEIGESHRLIAELARRGMIRAIITTNFDPYIEKALEEKGLTVQVITSDEDLKHSEPLIQCKKVRVYKPHGSLEKGKLLNTPKDLESLTQPMEDELVRIMSEHGIIVLGYAGKDPDIVKVFKKRNNHYYPLFWIDPVKPSGDIMFVFEDDRNSYIECTGASHIISDLIDLQERIESITPSFSNRPSITQLKNALSKRDQPIGPLFQDYYTSLIEELKQIQPDFSKFDEIDEAIFDQIKMGERISYQYIEATILACQYNDLDAIKAAYSIFESLVCLYDIPEGFEGEYKVEQFDGNKFLTYEMFLGLVASLLKYNRWVEIAHLLQTHLFVRINYQSSLESFIIINEYIRSLDERRNLRLNLNSSSVSADIIKERFESGRMKRFFTVKEIAEADYFLFMRTACRHDNNENLSQIWRPVASIRLYGPPSFISRSELDTYLEKVTIACGFNNPKEFITSLKKNHGLYNRYRRNFRPNDPLSFFDLEKLGSISESSPQISP
ncbi:SIR2 family protein [Methanosphaerula subterraneus]|uniref:SIR2 family protein n=1 Tax=Methanosphaerula subterraneus TaxID=3350244 RepID=UPI003F852D38